MPKNPPRTYKFSRLNKVAHHAIDWIGSVQSLAVHTFLFLLSFSLIFFGFDQDKVLLVVTTIVSLEAVYMAIFIQMAVNHNSKSLDAVEEDIDEIQEDVEEIQEDLDDIQEDVDEIEKDIDEIQKDVDEIEKDDAEDVPHEEHNKETLDKIELRLVRLLTQLEKMKDEMK